MRRLNPDGSSPSPSPQGSSLSPSPLHPSPSPSPSPYKRTRVRVRVLKNMDSSPTSLPTGLPTNGGHKSLHSQLHPRAHNAIVGYSSHLFLPFPPGHEDSVNLYNRLTIIAITGSAVHHAAFMPRACVRDRFGHFEHTMLFYYCTVGP